MQQASKAKLSLQERVYRALQEIAQSCRKADSEPDNDMLLDALVHWTTDDVYRDGNSIFSSTDKPDDDVGPEDFEDFTRLFNFVVHHIHSQQQAESRMKMAEGVIAEIRDKIDTNKLASQDQDEWQSLARLIADHEAGLPDFEFPEDEEFNLEKMLEEAGEAPVEGTAEEVAHEALKARIDGQAMMGQALGTYLEAVHSENGHLAHQIIDQFGCVLTHALTSMFISWVETRQVLPDDEELASWFKRIRQSAEEMAQMSDEEKIELAQHLLEHEDDEDY